MPAFLPPNLLALFAPRPPLEYRRPVDTLPWDKEREEKPEVNYSGFSNFLDRFEKKEDQPLPIREETRVERKDRIKKTRLENHKRQMQDDLMNWDPNKNKKSTIDPYKTLFCSKLDYETTEKKIRREFEQYGHIAEVKLVLDKITGKSKGYAFVEFESERDMRQAYKYAEGMKIDGKKVLVDVERGRSVQGWRPRRFGGGLGETRKDKEKKRDIKAVVEAISLKDGPQGGVRAFDQMRKFGAKDESTRDKRRREEKENTNYGGFGVDRSKFRGTGKYNPGNEAWSRKVDATREHHMHQVSNSRDVNQQDEVPTSFDSARDRKRQNGGAGDEDFDKSKIKREKRDRYEGYGGGYKNRNDDRDDRNVKREYRDRGDGGGRGGHHGGNQQRYQNPRHRDGRMKSTHEMQRNQTEEDRYRSRKSDYER